MRCELIQSLIFNEMNRLVQEESLQTANMNSIPTRTRCTCGDLPCDSQDQIASGIS